MFHLDVARVFRNRSIISYERLKQGFNNRCCYPPRRRLRSRHPLSRWFSVRPKTPQHRQPTAHRSFCAPSFLNGICLIRKIAGGFLFSCEFRWFDAGAFLLLGRGFKNNKTSLGLAVGDGHKDLRGFISGQFIVSGFDGRSHGTIKQIFMKCEVCGKPSKKRAKVFIKGDPLYLCQKCVLRLQRERLKYCEELQGYRFNGIRRQRGRL